MRVLIFKATNKKGNSNGKTAKTTELQSITTPVERLDIYRFTKENRYKHKSNYLYLEL